MTDQHAETGAPRDGFRRALDKLVEDALDADWSAWHIGYEAAPWLIARIAVDALLDTEQFDGGGARG